MISITFEPQSRAPLTHTLRHFDTHTQAPSKHDLKRIRAATSNAFDAQPRIPSNHNLKGLRDTILTFSTASNTLSNRHTSFADSVHAPALPIQTFTSFSTQWQTVQDFQHLKYSVQYFAQCCWSGHTSLRFEIYIVELSCYSHHPILTIQDCRFTNLHTSTLLPPHTLIHSHASPTHLNVFMSFLCPTFVPPSTQVHTATFYSLHCSTYPCLDVYILS